MFLKVTVSSQLPIHAGSSAAQVGCLSQSFTEILKFSPISGFEPSDIESSALSPGPKIPNKILTQFINGELQLF